MVIVLGLSLSLLTRIMLVENQRFLALFSNKHLNVFLPQDLIIIHFLLRNPLLMLDCLFELYCSVFVKSLYLMERNLVYFSCQTIDAY